MATDNYISNGGKWFTMLPIERRKIFTEIFESLPLIIEIDHQIGKVGIIHADVPHPNWQTLCDMISSDEEAPSMFELNIREKAVWSRSRIQKQDTSVIREVERVYVGHTPLKEWSILGNIYFIDTGCVFNNKLTLLEVK